MGNGFKCNCNKSSRERKFMFKTVKGLSEMIEYDINTYLEIYKEYFVGPYFLLDVENDVLSYKEKEKYLDKIILLIKISNYDKIYKKKYKSSPNKINKKDINSNNHKEIFKNIIFNQDLTIINSLESIKNILFYYENRPNDLKKIIFKGPPQIFRFILWRIYLNKNQILIKINDYLELNKISLSDEIIREINSDLGRTFPDLRIYKNECFRDKLKVLLEKLACFDKELNYVQGINFMIGYILLIDGGNEYSSFNFFIFILNFYSFITNESFRDSLTPGFKFLFNYVDTFSKIFEKHNIKLKEKLAKHGLSEFFWFSKWVQTLFTYNFNFYTVTRFWDFIFSEGLDFIILISLSILDLLEKDLLQGKEMDDCLRLFDKAYKFDQEKSKDLIKIIVKNSKKKEFTKYFNN